MFYILIYKGNKKIHSGISNYLHISSCDRYCCNSCKYQTVKEIKSILETAEFLSRSYSPGNPANSIWTKEDWFVEIPAPR